MKQHVQRLPVASSDAAVPAHHWPQSKLRRVR
jgi:hypothetical protein